jgi:hypothetical protein
LYYYLTTPPPFLAGTNAWIKEVTSNIFFDDGFKRVFTAFDIYDKYLYTTNENSRNINTFDFNYNKVEGFLFSPINIPENYISTNVKVINKLVYVVYSSFAIGGIVNVYNLDGTYIKTLINDPTLRNPFGIVQTSKFGKYSCMYLVGSRNDSTISVYNREGELKGKLKDVNGNNIVIQGLKSLKFYDNKLYYASSNENESVSTIGYIKPIKCKH